MEFDLRAAINDIDQRAIFEIANAARPPANYLFASVLPPINMDTYDIDGGALTIRTTMAGLSGMDSKYAPGGAAAETKYQGKTGKITITNELPEKFLRSLQNLLTRLTASGVSTADEISATGINFVDKIIVQAILDREEWLRGQALVTGALDWTFNGIRLQADYGIPAANFLTNRTGNDAYGGSTSKWWTDYYSAQEILGWRISACIMGPALLKDLMTNSEVNQLQFVAADPSTNTFVFRRLVTRGGNTVLSSDPRDFITIICYNKEGEIWDLDNAGETLKIPFMPEGAVLWLGEHIDSSVFQVGLGGNDQQSIIDNPVQLGYTHIAPTVEGGGASGRWARLYTPQDRPWTMAADGVANLLPVIQAPDRIVIGSSDVSA